MIFQKKSRCHAVRVQERAHPILGSVVNERLTNTGQCDVLAVFISLDFLSHHHHHPHLCDCGIVAPNLKWPEWWRTWVDVWTWWGKWTNTSFSEYHGFLSFWRYLYHPLNRKVVMDIVHWSKRKMDPVSPIVLLNPTTIWDQPFIKD